MYNFANKYAIVTGAGKGIGRVIAERLVQEGIEGLAIIDYDENLVNKAAEELQKSCKKVLALCCDISNPDKVKESFDLIQKEFGRIDILVNNAGITRDAIFHKMTPEQMHQVMDVNYFGTYNCLYNAVPVMREQCYGRIVNISSTSSYGNAGQANYSASKAAIEGLTRTLAKELGRKGITINCVLPGYIDTEMMRAIPEDMLKQRIAATPMQRMGQPEEVAALVAFLASDEASYVSGASIICSGGSIIH